MELNLMVKKNEQLRSQQIQKVTIFRQERILKNNPEQKDHTQVDFQGNFININTSNQLILNSLKELQRVGKKGNCLIDFMMKCNMDIYDNEDDLKERNQVSQAHQCINLTRNGSLRTQHCTFKVLHTNQLEFLLEKSIHIIYNTKTKFSKVGRSA